uniref:Major facilitator superfamily (MFS) profile domain-containing protein n=1 Tax=Zooxanthella nutricula TaxID=1333877 RepID=A0A7S2LY59_9DINO
MSTVVIATVVGAPALRQESGEAHRGAVSLSEPSPAVRSLGLASGASGGPVTPTPSGASTSGSVSAAASIAASAASIGVAGALTADEDVANRMPPLGSLALLLLLPLLVGTNLVIVIPTADDYSHRLGGDQLFGGLMISSIPLGAWIGIYLNQWMLRGMSFKSVLIVITAGTIFGNVLYALAGLMCFKWTLLISRVVIGLCNGFSLPCMYISLTVGLKRRSEVVLYFSAATTLGYAVGPTLAAVLDVFLKSVRVHNLVLDSDTAPGWFMALLYLIFLVLIVIVFEDLPMHATQPGPRGSANAGDRFPLLSSCAAFWHLFVTSAQLTMAEVYLVFVGQQHWGWSIAKSALLLAGLMFCSGVINMSMGKLGQRIMRSDRAGLLGGSIFSCVACIPLSWSLKLQGVIAEVSVLSAGLLMLVALAGLNRAFALALTSKLVPSSLKRPMNEWATVMMTLGRAAGGVLGAVLNADSFAPAMLGLCVVSVVVSVASHKAMKPNDKAD